MLTKIHLLICLIAAIAVCVLNLANNVPFENAVINLITIIVLFYFLGFAVKYYLNKHVFTSKIKAEEDSAQGKTVKKAEESKMPEENLEDYSPADSLSGHEDLSNNFAPSKDRRPRKPVPVGVEAEANEDE